ncbi:hypothetical protein A4U53_003190 (plasmid) [Rhizobium ruizarguesonis]|uniref:Uncharacterized protein n=1 Tax=Rhizobium ruizarguesonis TaxID=2081791 RepID=A0ACD5EG21_9HYPH
MQAWSLVVKSEPSRPSHMKRSGISGEGEERHAPKNIVATALDESTELKMRTDGDYRRLALEILKSQAWKDMPSNTGRKKNRAIGRLMSRALSGG